MLRGSLACSWSSKSLLIASMGVMEATSSFRSESMAGWVGLPGLLLELEEPVDRLHGSHGSDIQLQKRIDGRVGGDELQLLGGGA